MLKLFSQHPLIVKVLGGFLTALVLAYVALGLVVWRAMHQSTEAFGRVMAKVAGPVVFMLYPFETMWTHARAGSLKVGDPAPDFSLLKLDGTEKIQLSTLNQQQPVVLVFGSYTCPPFRREAPQLNQLYQQYKGRVAFLVVYISEAHPSDFWQTASNVKENIVFASPKTVGERAIIAGTCVRKLGLTFPAVLDDLENSTDRAYTGWPDRIYLIGKQGKIAFMTTPGPFGFKPDLLEAALTRAVGTVPVK